MIVDSTTRRYSSSISLRAKIEICEILFRNATCIYYSQLSAVPSSVDLTENWARIPCVQENSGRRRVAYSYIYRPQLFCFRLNIYF